MADGAARAGVESGLSAEAIVDVEGGARLLTLSAARVVGDVLRIVPPPNRVISRSLPEAVELVWNAPIDDTRYNLQVKATSGSLTLTFITPEGTRKDGSAFTTAAGTSQTTAPIPFAPTDVDVRSALEALSNIDVGDVRVVDLGEGAIAIDFIGQYAGTYVGTLTLDPSGLGGVELADLQGPPSSLPLLESIDYFRAEVWTGGFDVGTLVREDRHATGEELVHPTDDHVDHFMRVCSVSDDGATSDWIEAPPVAPLIASTLDGDPPASSPAVVVRGGPGFLLIEWDPVANADPVTYDVFLDIATIDAPPAPALKVGETDSTFMFVKADAAGVPLAYDTTYFVRVVARDDDGVAAAGVEGSGQLVRSQTDDHEPLSITTALIADAAIATAKIADLAVSTAKIANLTVTTGKIANLAVQTGKIQNLAVTEAKIAALAVTDAKIANLSANKLTAGDVTAQQIRIGNIFDGSEFYLDFLGDAGFPIRWWNGTESRFSLSSAGDVVARSADFYPRDAATPPLTIRNDKGVGRLLVAHMDAGTGAGNEGLILNSGGDLAIAGALEVGSATGFPSARLGGGAWSLKRFGFDDWVGADVPDASVLGLGAGAAAGVALQLRERATPAAPPGTLGKEMRLWLDGSRRLKVIDDTSRVSDLTRVMSGTGSPEGVVTAPVATLFVREDGGAGTTLYVKESGVGNTGWAAK